MLLTGRRAWAEFGPKKEGDVAGGRRVEQGSHVSLAMATAVVATLLPGRMGVAGVSHSAGIF